MIWQNSLTRDIEIKKKAEVNSFLIFGVPKGHPIKELLNQAGIRREEVLNEVVLQGGAIEVELMSKAHLNKVLNGNLRGLWLQEGSTKLYVAVTQVPQKDLPLHHGLHEHQILIKFDREYSSGGIQFAFDRFSGLLSGEPVLDFVVHPKIINYFIATLALKEDVRYLLREKNRKKVGDVTLYLSEVDFPVPLTPVMDIKDSVAYRISKASEGNSQDDSLSQN